MQLECSPASRLLPPGNSGLLGRPKQVLFADRCEIDAQLRIHGSSGLSIRVDGAV
jgi:hypothetical protein